MPDRTHVAPAGRLVRGRAGGRLRRSILTVARAAALGWGRPSSSRRGRCCPGALFVVTTRGSYLGRRPPAR